MEHIMCTPKDTAQFTHSLSGICDVLEYPFNKHTINQLVKMSDDLSRLFTCSTQIIYGNIACAQHNHTILVLLVIGKEDS